MNNKFISIAGFTIRLQALEKRMISLEESYLPFLLQQKYLPSDLVITSVQGIRKDLLQKSDLLFEAKNDEQKFFSIYHHEDSYRFLIYNQQKEDEIQQVAILDSNLCEWTVYSKITNERGEIFPLLYPLGPLVLYYLTLKSDSVLMHASGIYDGVKGRLFTGFSGAGKSTMAYLWQKSGAKIINDDRLIIRKENGVYVMYNTPMFYVDIPKKANLDSIYIIKHARTNNKQKLKGVSAVSRLMAFIIQHNYDTKFIDRHLSFISELCNNITVHEVGFLPDASIIDHIKNHEF